MTSIRSVFAAIGLLVIFAVALMPAHANPSELSMGYSLDQEIENLKENVLSLNADLMMLEDELFFPPYSQVSVYLSVEEGVDFPLSVLRLKIDDAEVALSSYTLGQLAAFAKGGIQHLYIGNMEQGAHTISAKVTGADSSGQTESYEVQFKVTKHQQPTLIELRIVNTGSREYPKFKLERWML